MTAVLKYRLLKCERGIAALEFVMLAPVLLALVFSIFVYSIYFSASVGVKQAAAEGARAAVAGLTFDERDKLAKARAGEAIQNYRSVLGDPAKALVTTTAGTSPGTFKVTVSYDMSGSAIMRYNAFVPLPSSKIIQASVTVTNGGY